LHLECIAGAQIIFFESGRGLGHVIATIFGSTVGYPSDSLASCQLYLATALTLSRPLLPYGYGYKVSCARPR